MNPTTVELRQETSSTEGALAASMPTDSIDTAPLLQWTAPEFVQHPKGRRWLVIAAVAILALVADAIWTGSWTMAVAFIVLAGVYTLAHHRSPAQVSIKITNFDVQVGGRSIPYNQIKAFWILYQPPALKTLKLLTSDKFMSELAIQLEAQAPGPVRELLLKHIPEYEGKRESFVETVIRVFKL